MKYPNISVYPTTKMMKGKETREDVIHNCAKRIVLDYYYGHRFDKNSLEELFKVVISDFEKLKKEIN